MTLAELLASVRRVEVRTNRPRERHDGRRVSEALQGARHGLRGVARPLLQSRKPSRHFRLNSIGDSATFDP